MIAVLAGELRGHGRTKACLACCNELSKTADVHLYADTGSWSPNRLLNWHGIGIDATWHLVDWDTQHNTASIVSGAEAAIAWAKPLAGSLRPLETHTVAWVESGFATGVDSIWTPSPTVADRCRHALAGRDDQPTVHALPPTWYLDRLPEPTDRERDIDVLLHGRKARDAEERLPDELTVVATGGFTHAELVERFERSKVFCHPRGPRFEALGLMPLEAARYGCTVAVPANSGAADLIPDCSYEHPVSRVPELLDANASAPTIPDPAPPDRYL